MEKVDLGAVFATNDTSALSSEQYFDYYSSYDYYFSPSKGGELRRRMYWMSTYNGNPLRSLLTHARRSFGPAQQSNFPRPERFLPHHLEVLPQVRMAKVGAHRR